MIRRLVVAWFFAISPMLAPGAAPDLANASGPELIARLNEPRTRDAAFRELYRRTEPEGEFKRPHAYLHPEVIVCPQPDGPPIYIVLCDSAGEPQSETSYTIADVEALFPPAEESAPRDAPAENWREDKVIFAYSAKGERLTPFGGWNSLRGYIFDMNGDGFTERIETQNYGTERNDETIEFLRVDRAGAKSTPLLAVAINRGSADEFGWAIQRERDGKHAVLVGPKEPLGSSRFEPPRPGWRLKSVAATFRWNEARQRYDGPRGSPEEHFILVDRDEDFGAAMKSIRAAPPFPAQPIIADASPPPQRSPTAAEKWQYVSLRDRTDAELVEIMTGGKDANEAERDAVVRTNVPAAFWDLPPKEAALALVEANRSPENRRACRIAMDDRDGAQPPTAGEIGYERRDNAHFIMPGAGRTIFHYKPGASRCSTAEVGLHRTGPPVLADVLKRALKKARSAPVPDDLARHVYEAVWWLSRVRSLCASDATQWTSTADVALELWMQPDVQPRLSLRIPSQAISTNWSAGYNRETFANFAFVVLTELITTKLKLIDPAAEPPMVGAPRKYSPDEDFVYNPKPPDPTDALAAEAYVSRMLRIMRGEGESLPPAFYTMSRLVPDEEPLRYRDGRIDAALLEIARREAQGRSGDSNQAWAAHALALRDRAEAFPILMHLLERNSGTAVDRALDGAALFVLKHPEHRPGLRGYLEHALAHIDQLKMPARRLFDVVWIGQFRELSPMLHDLSTASVEEIASWRSSGSGGSPDAERGRFHEARRILTAWQEEDPLTQAKLFATYEVFTHRYFRAPSLTRPLYEKLPPHEQQAYRGFVAWYKQREERNSPVSDERLKRLDQLLAEAQ